MREMTMIETGITVKANDREYPVLLDGRKFYVDLGDGYELRASSVGELQEMIRDKVATTRFELPFTSQSGANGVVTGFHVGNNSMLVRWASGRTSQEHSLAGVLHRLSADEHAELDRLLAAVSVAQGNLTRFLTPRRFGNVRSAARDAQRKAAGLGGDDA